MVKGKKRYFLMAFLAIEVLSLPAAAQIVQRVSFEIRPQVTAVEIPTAEPGFSRFLVASNAGFGIKADQIIGDVNVSVHVSGTISGESHFGHAAQLPGQKEICAQSTGLDTVVYKADRKTAARPGTPPEQAVVFEIRYAEAAQPTFSFVAGVDKTSTLTPCTGGIS